MDLIPAVNTSYLSYLQSETWKKTRNRALNRAHFTCQRCGAKRNIQVHHRSYEHLGFEFDSDLEVLCRNCHEGEHLQQMHDAGGEHRLYIKLANDVLRAQPYDSIADLSDAVRTECARLKIKYSHHHVNKALSLISGASFGKERTQTAENVLQAKVDGRALTEQQAREAWRMITNVLGGSFLREMPRAKPSTIDIYGPPPRENFGEHDRY